MDQEIKNELILVRKAIGISMDFIHMVWASHPQSLKLGNAQFHAEIAWGMIDELLARPDTDA